MRNTTPHPDQQPSGVCLDLLKLKATGKNNHRVMADLSYQGLTALTEHEEVTLHADFHLAFSTTGFTLYGTLKGELPQPCDTCGAEFNRVLDLDVNEDFVFAHLSPKYGSADRELGEDDFYEVQAIDVPFDITLLCKELLILALSVDAYCPEHENKSADDAEEDDFE